MPCACKVVNATYPETADWGPLFWRALHGLAEYSGRQKDVLLQGIELRSWLQILTELQDTLPCEECRGHYKAYLTANPVIILKTMAYKDLRPWVRKWLFDLHNDVNRRLGKALFVFDTLETEYKDVCISTVLAQLTPVMMRAIKLRGAPIKAWKTWTFALKQLLGFY